MSEKKQQLPEWKKLLENRQYTVIGGMLAALLAVILIGILALDIPVVPLCVILLLQTGIAVCLDNEQVWLHGILLLVEFTAGILAGQIIFMILVMLIYVAAIFGLKYWKET